MRVALLNPDKILAVILNRGGGGDTVDSSSLTTQPLVRSKKNVRENILTFFVLALR
jgi:hypothetical protein